MTIFVEGFQEGDYGIWLEEEAPYYLEGSSIVERSTGEKKGLNEILELEENSWIEEDDRIKDDFLWIYKTEKIIFSEEDVEEESEEITEESDTQDGEDAWAKESTSGASASGKGSAKGIKGIKTDGSSRGNPNSSSGSSVKDGKKYYVCDGAKLKCSFGDDESTLNIIDIHKIYIQGNPIATMMDNKPMVNIQPFGKCKSMANPTVAAATAANYGRLQKMPCIPVIPAPWLKGKMDVKVKGTPAILEDAKLNCAYAGIIEVSDPGQDLVKG